MTDFDETTERLAAEASGRYNEQMLFKRGRNSCLESLEIMARAVDEISHIYYTSNESHTWGGYKHQKIAKEAIAQIRKRGDWPLREGE